MLRRCTKRGDAVYAQPDKLDEALRLLKGDVAALQVASEAKKVAKNNANPSEPWTILAGGTDFYPASFETPKPRRVLDIHALTELKRIDKTTTGIRIGAGVTWSDVINADLPCAFDALKLAAHEVGSVQIQNQATVVGNVCNASPAADGVPPLLVLNASVELSSSLGVREIALSEFILGNRVTARRTDEMVTAIVIPAESTNGNSTFLKLGARKYLIISISMVAVRLQCDQAGVINDAAISVGSCSLVAQRLVELEQHVLSKPAAGDLGQLVSVQHIEPLAPIDDVRSTAIYREQASLELIQRALTTAGHSFK